MGKWKKKKWFHVFASLILIVQFVSPVHIVAEEQIDDGNPTNHQSDDPVMESPPEENIPVEDPPQESTPEPTEPTPNEEEVEETEQPPEEVPSETDIEEPEMEPKDSPSEKDKEEKDEPKRKNSNEAKQENKGTVEEKASQEKKDFKKEPSPEKESPLDGKKLNKPSYLKNDKPTADVEKRAKVSGPREITHDLPKDISDFVTEAYLENSVISSTKKHINLHVHLTEEVKLKGTVWDALHQDAGPFGDGNLGGVLGEDLFYWNEFSYGPGEDQLEISSTYCSLEWVQTPCADELEDGVYTIKLSALVDNFLIDGEIPIGPVFVKRTSATVDFDSISMDEGFIRGKVSDKFIDWAPFVQEVYEEEYDVNEYLFATYQLENADNQLVEEDSLILDQDGTFTIPVHGLMDGNYTVTVKIEDIGENEATEENMTFQVGRDESGEETDEGQDENKVFEEAHEEQEALNKSEAVQEIEFGETVSVESNEMIKVKGEFTSIQFQEDLTEGTTLKIERVEDEHAAGDVMEVEIDSKEEGVESSLLTLAIASEYIDHDLAIYSYNDRLEEWEYLGGDIDYRTDTISTRITGSSTYGVFVLDEKDR